MHNLAQGLAIDCIREALEHLGMDMDDPSTRNTPKRFVKLLYEFQQTFDDSIFNSTFESTTPEGVVGGMVLQKQIPFTMLCEHHLMPAIGHASLAYIPAGKVIGISKLSRIVDGVGREKPSLQEHICERIVDLVHAHLEPLGVMCVITATHGCMACRGVKAPAVETVYSAFRGKFEEEKVREEFFHLVNQRSR